MREISPGLKQEMSVILTKRTKYRQGDTDISKDDVIRLVVIDTTGSNEG